MSWTIEPYICIGSRCKKTHDLVRVHDEHGQPFGPFCRECAADFIKRTDVSRKKKRTRK